jgi:hypothetical protein
VKLTRAEIAETTATIFGKLAQGESDESIADEMGLPLAEFDKLKKAMFEAKAEEIRAKPTEHVYIEYIINQSRNLTALDAILSEYKTTRQHAAMVGAIKTRSEIYDKIVKIGQEFGLIKKEPDKTQIIAGIAVTEMSNKQLKSAITMTLVGLNKLTKRYGEGGIVDMDPGELHSGPMSLPPPPVTPKEEPEKLAAKSMEKPKGRGIRSKTSRVSGGRRVVKNRKMEIVING